VSRDFRPLYYFPRNYPRYDPNYKTETVSKSTECIDKMFEQILFHSVNDTEATASTESIFKPKKVKDLQSFIWR
jgi:hypothetical protein